MYEGEWITRGMSFGDNVDPTDADYRHRRRRFLEWCQNTWNDVWNLNDWRWKRTLGSLVFPAQSYEAPLPDDFGNIPEQGGIFFGTQRIGSVNDQIVQDVQQGGGGGQSPLIVSLAGWSPTLRKTVVQLNVQGPFTLPIYYNKKAPQLADRPWSGLPTVAAGAAGARTGTYQVLQTYTTQDGYEHEPSDIATITVAAKKLVVTPADPGPFGEHKVKYINLYATEAGGSAFYRFVQIAVTSAAVAAYTDDTADGALVLLTPFVETSPMLTVPEDYHHSVLLPGTMAKTKRSKGDTRDWAAEFEAGKARMQINERPRRDTPQRIPRVCAPNMW